MVYALFVGTAAFLVAVIAGKPVVDFLARRGLGKQISVHGPASHLVKAGTPTMGGLLIFGTVFLVTAPTNLFDKRSIFLPLGIIVATGTLGLIDDFLTVEGRAKGRAGLNTRLKTALLPHSAGSSPRRSAARLQGQSLRGCGKSTDSRGFEVRCYSQQRSAPGRNLQMSRFMEKQRPRGRQA